MTLRDFYKHTEGFSLDYELMFEVSPENAKTMVLKSIDDVMEIETDDYRRMIMLTSGVKNITPNKN